MGGRKTSRAVQLPVGDHPTSGGWRSRVTFTIYSKPHQQGKLLHTNFLSEAVTTDKENAIT